MEIVKLTPRTHKGKNKLMEAALAMPETWGWTWLVAERRETIQAKGGDGPWLFLVPTGVAPEITDKLSRWVHEMADKDFSVMRSNVELTGAAAGLSPQRPATEGSEVERRVGGQADASAP